MNSNVDYTTGERLTLRSQLAEMAQIPAWIERLASQYSIPDTTQFAMNLCLEEVVSNVIRHGYGGQPDRPITVEFATSGDGHFMVAVEDEAPAFDPLNAPELPTVSAADDSQLGGQGIRLLREFSHSLDYQRTPSGNRLSIGFEVS
jgi:anti-sigma regulatory factor (Ser/Thr protein kinase)